MSLQFIIDNLCANFTVKSVYRLVETMLAERPCTIGEIALRVADQDRSLDIGSAQSIAEAAIEALAQTGVIAVQDSYISRAD